MSYLGIVPVITITSQDAGDIRFQEYTVNDDTTFCLTFPEANVPQEILAEITLAGNFTITWGDSSTFPIQWTEGSEPSLTTGKHLIKFVYDGNGEIFATVIGTNI